MKGCYRESHWKGRSTGSYVTDISVNATRDSQVYQSNRNRLCSPLYTVNFSAGKISILVRCTIWDTKFSRAWTFFQNSLMHHSRFKIEASTQKNSGPIWHHLNYFQGLLWRLYKNDQLGIESCENHDWKSWISLLRDGFNSQFEISSSLAVDPESDFLK